MNNSSIVRNNERSWAIEIICQINMIAKSNDLVIKKVGGESTVSYSHGGRMFPDLLLYSDDEMINILQGWELKMPDVPITDETFIKDAQRKARALRLPSFIIWNFTYIRFYVLNPKSNEFEIAKQWENLHIRTRQDVKQYRNEWIKTLEDIILFINRYLLDQKMPHTSIGEVISDNAIHMLINDYKSDVAKNYKEASISDVNIEAEISSWWNEIKLEYQFDEIDKYKAYAKTVLLNWTYRIIFAHLIKTYQKSALKINDIDFEMGTSEANIIFNEITNHCDFYNIFEPIPFNELLPNNAWEALIELSLFLRDNGIKSVNQSMLQNILEQSIKTSRREINGQFPTPKTLARLLARLTVHDWNENVIDPCCGTGTIPHAILEIKKEKIGVNAAINSTWASDKYKLPLQIANISMTSSDTMNLANRLFQKNAFDLFVGSYVPIVNPQDGELMNLPIPYFGAICTNLPFVSSEIIPQDDMKFAEKIGQDFGLDKKSDLCYYLPLHLSNLLKERGYLGIITSNAWLGTSAGNKFFNALRKSFNILQVHISGKDRWFTNADVVTTIIILQKKSDTPEPPISFYIWKSSLNEIESDIEIEDHIVYSSIRGHITNDEFISVSTYTMEMLEDLHSLNLSYNALFHEVKWLTEIQNKLIPLNKYFKVIRGNRRGWDPLFFPKYQHSIESTFLRPALFNAKNVTSLIATPDREAFSCSEDIETLQTEFPGAFSWISKFKTQKNGKGRFLPDVLERKNEKWFEMKPNEIVDIFTMMNPDKRIFFGRFESPAFINQRLIGLKKKSDNIDSTLFHALLNSVLMKFFIEAVGFGRGLGVLDINRDSISKCFILNPDLLSEDQKTEIKESFRKLVKLDILSVEEELKNQDWLNFNKLVLQAFGIEEYLQKIISSLISLREIRFTAIKSKDNKKVVNSFISDFNNTASNISGIAAEPYEVYQLSTNDYNCLTHEMTILIGCYRNKNHLEWILNNKIYNIRLGRRKGSMENDRKYFENVRLLYLYDVNHPSKNIVLRITGNQEMTGSELKELNYPSKTPGKRYMTFTLEQLDYGQFSSINIREFLNSLSNHEKGTPVFIEPKN